MYDNLPRKIFKKRLSFFCYILVFFICFNICVPPAHAVVPAAIVGSELGYVIAKTMVAAGLGFSVANKKAIESAISGYWQYLSEDIKNAWVAGINAGSQVFEVTNIMWDSLFSYVQSNYSVGDNTLNISESYVPVGDSILDNYVSSINYNGDIYRGGLSNGRMSLYKNDVLMMYGVGGTGNYVNPVNICIVYTYSSASGGYRYLFKLSCYTATGEFYERIANSFSYDLGITDLIFNTSSTATLTGESGVIDEPTWDWSSPSDPQGRRMVGLPVSEFPTGFGEGVKDVATNVWDRIIEGLADKNASDIINSLDVTNDLPIGFYDTILARVQAMANGISGILEGLSFFPSEQYMIGFYQEISDNFNNKIPLISQLKQFWDSIFNVNYGQVIPEFQITLPIKWGGTTHSVIDFGFFTEYRDWVINFIRFTAWFIFLKRLYRRMPSVIY